MDSPLKKITSFLNKTPRRTYFIKAVFLLCVLFIIAKLTPTVPSIVVAVFWGFLTFISAIGFAYFAVVRKTEKQVAKFREGGNFAKLNEGRFFRFLISFILAAVFSASFLISLSKWGQTYWLLIGIATILYYPITTIVRYKVEIEYKPLFRYAGIAKITFWICVILLCIFAFAITISTASVSYNSIIDALSAANEPFANSPSTLLADAGHFSTASEIIITYGIPKAFETPLDQFPLIAAIVATLLLYASVFVGFVSLLNICYIPIFELRRVFTPLLTEQSQAKPSLSHELPSIRKYVVYTVIFFLATFLAFIALDIYFSNTKSIDGYTPLESITYEILDDISLVIDEKNLADQISERLINESKNTTSLFGGNNTE